MSLLIKLRVHFFKSITQNFLISTFGTLCHYLKRWEKNCVSISLAERYFFRVIYSAKIAWPVIETVGFWTAWVSRATTLAFKSESCNSLSNSLCFPSRAVWRTRKTDHCNPLNFLFIYYSISLAILNFESFRLWTTLYLPLNRLQSNNIIGIYN